MADSIGSMGVLIGWHGLLASAIAQGWRVWTHGQDLLKIAAEEVPGWWTPLQQVPQAVHSSLSVPTFGLLQAGWFLSSCQIQCRQLL